MATALALTPNLSNGSVLLQVTGAPVLTPAYTQGTGVDGWAASNGTIASGVAYTGAVGFLLHANSLDGSDFAVATKTIAGLTIGTQYRMTAWYKRGANSAEAALGVSGIGVMTSTTATSTWQQLEYVFTATATSHTLQTFVRGNSGFDTQGDVYFDDIKLEATGTTYRPTTITRTDANGSNPVRLQDGQEPISGSMTVTDYEAALTGSIRYDVVDSSNVTTSASTTLGGTAGTKPILHVPVLPQLRANLDAVKGYTARRDATSTLHRIIGRSDPIDIGGPLSSREGTLTVYAANHTDANALASVIDSGEVLMLRQVDHPGMDLYLTPRSVSVMPDQSTASGWRWEVTLDYAEVAVPSGALLGAVGWTYASVSGGYATYASVKAAFSTYSALVVGP